jgi:uncharacterized protein
MEALEQNEPCLFSVMGKHFLFDPVTLCTLELDEHALKALRNRKGVPLSRLLSETSDIAAPEDGAGGNGDVEAILELRELAKNRRILAEDRRFDHELYNLPIRAVVFNISHDCNLRCRYCFAEAGRHGGSPSLMTEETAVEALDMLWEACHSHFAVSFFGGEPLLNFGVIRAIVEYAKCRSRETGKTLDFSLTTNGTLLNSGITDFMIVNNFNMVLSLDGPGPLHDEMRVYVNGKGSHLRIRKNLELIKDTNLAKRTTLRGTFPGSNASLVERILYLDKLCEDGYAANFSVEPADLPQESPIGFTPGRIEKLSKEYEEAARIYADALNEGRQIRFFHFNLFLRRVLKAERYTRTCSAGIGYAIVSPDGNLYSCHREGETKIGTVKGGFDPSLRDSWRKNTIYDKRECSMCWARYLCGGECMHDSIEYTGDPLRPYWVNCEFKKLWIKLAVWIASGLNDEARARFLGKMSKHNTRSKEARNAKREWNRG